MSLKSLCLKVIRKEIKKCFMQFNLDRNFIYLEMVRHDIKISYNGEKYIILGEERKEEDQIYFNFIISLMEATGRRERILLNIDRLNIDQIYFINIKKLNSCVKNFVSQIEYITLPSVFNPKISLFNDFKQIYEREFNCAIRNFYKRLDECNSKQIVFDNMERDTIWRTINFICYETSHFGIREKDLQYLTTQHREINNKLMYYYNDIMKKFSERNVLINFPEPRV